ncbi:MAG: FTR1 family protein [Mariprofundales bacterium]
MLATFIIVFREALEAMLVVGIATAAAREVKIGCRWIYGGVAGGLAAAIIVALFAESIAALASGMGQEVLNATILIAAATLMIWTAVLMSKHGKEVSNNIHRACQQQENGSAHWVLATIVGLAVAREGAEIVLFLYGVAASSSNGSDAMLIGAAMGLLLGIVVAIGIYHSLAYLPIRHLFTVTTWLIVLLAAGMASQGISFLVMVDLLPAWGQIIWDTSSILPERTAFGQLLHAFMGYEDRPNGMQAAGFFAVIILAWFAIRMQNGMRTKSVATAAILCIVTSLFSMPETVQCKQVYSPIVEEGEVEFEYLLDYSVDSNPTQNGSARHQFEFEYGVNDRWLTAIYGDFRKSLNQGFAYQGAKWENIYQLFEQGERWLDAGLYFEYIIPKSSLNKPDRLEFKLLFEKEYGRIINTANIILNKELGAHAKSNTNIGYAWKSKWRWRRTFEPAIEIYGALGEIGNTKQLAQQQHQIGPVILGKLRNGLSYEVGYLFGLTTTSAQGMIKGVIGYEF